MPEKTIKVREFRLKPPALGGGGHTGGRQSRVIESSAEYELSSFSEQVPDDTPLHDWEDEK